MGSLSYDLKDLFEQLKSEQIDYTEYPLAHFWVPKFVIHLEKEKYEYLQGEQDEDSFQFLDYFMEEEIDHNFHSFPYRFQARTSKDRYISQVEKLKSHIQRGDIYEVNYCQEFYSENVELDYPLDTYFKLNHITKALQFFTDRRPRCILRKSRKVYEKNGNTTFISAHQRNCSKRRKYATR